jgi:hypothetical protein
MVAAALAGSSNVVPELHVDEGGGERVDMVAKSAEAAPSNGVKGRSDDVAEVVESAEAAPSNGDKGRGDDVAEVAESDLAAPSTVDIGTKVAESQNTGKSTSESHFIYTITFTTHTGGTNGGRARRRRNDGISVEEAKQVFLHVCNLMMPTLH